MSRIVKNEVFLTEMIKQYKLFMTFNMLFNEHERNYYKHVFVVKN